MVTELEVIEAQVMGADEDGNPVILFDTRWAHPELLGYKPTDPMYRALCELHARVTGTTQTKKEKCEMKDRTITQITKEAVEDIAASLKKEKPTEVFELSVGLCQI